MTENATYIHNTFLNKLFGVRVEAHSVAFAPQTHTGRIVASAAFIRRAHGEHLTPVSGQQQSVFPSVQTRSARAQRKAVVRDVNEARVAPAVRERAATLLVSPRVRLVPVIRRDRDRQEAQGDERQTETRVQKPLPRRHRSLKAADQHLMLDSSLINPARACLLRAKWSKCAACRKHAPRI